MPINLCAIHRNSKRGKRGEDFVQGVPKETYTTTLTDIQPDFVMPIEVSISKEIEKDKWKNKYFRDNPIFVFVNKVDYERGYVKTFTLLFQGNFSFTFRAFNKKEFDAAKKAKNEAISRQKGNSKAKEDHLEEGKNEENGAIKAFGTGNGMAYKSVFYVPEAQFIIKDDTGQKPTWFV